MENSEQQNVQEHYNYFPSILAYFWNMSFFL